MKTRLCLNQRKRAAARLFSAAATAVFCCLLGVGCVAIRGGKSSGQAAMRLAVLGDSIEPLLQQFNADKDKLRVLALLSPT